MTKKYWCPTCGDVPAIQTMGIALLVTHKADCIGFHAIPVVEPLDVPEVTTWGESGGAEAVCLRAYFDDVIYIRGRLFTFPDLDSWVISDGQRASHPDVVTAINYVAGVRR